MSEKSNESIEHLLERIKYLEISNQKLEEDVKQLKQQVDKGKPSSSKQAREPQFIDRYGREIDIGDTVYIITPGAFTHISREGTVVGFDEYRDRVHIRDTAGNPQERAPKNVKLVKKKGSH